MIYVSFNGLLLSDGEMTIQIPPTLYKDCITSVVAKLRSILICEVFRVSKVEVRSSSHNMSFAHMLAHTVFCQCRRTAWIEPHGKC